MSSRSYYVAEPVYVPSAIELARERMKNIKSKLGQADRLKQQILAGMSKRATRVTEARVQAVSFGELALETLQQIDVETVATAAVEKNAEQAKSVSGVIDYSEFFESDISREQAASLDAVEYLEAAKTRASKLVALSSGERDLVSRFIRRCDEMAQKPGTAEDVRPFIEEGLEGLCLRLGEKDSAKRAELYLNYLSLCQVTGEAPRDLTYAEMAAAVQRIEEDIALEEFRDWVAESLDEALLEVGLENVGTATLEEGEGKLVVDEEGGPCALFVERDDNGAFMFTTVSAVDPAAMSRDEQYAAREAAKRLCTKKERLLNEALAKRGIVTEVAYDYPPDLRFVEKSDDFARYVASAASGRARDVAEGGAQRKEAE